MLCMLRKVYYIWTCSYAFQLSEHLQEVEDEAMAKTVELEKQLSESNCQVQHLKV